MAQVPLTSKILAVASTADTTEKKSALANSPAEYYTMQDIIDTVNENGTGGYTYTEVEVSSAELLQIGSVPQTILPELDPGQFYTYYGFLYYNIGTNNSLDLVDNLFLGELQNYSGTLFSSGIQLSLNSTVQEFSSLTKQNGTVLYNASTDVVTYGQPLSGQAIKLTSWGGNDATPNDFNGSVTIKIWHKIITF